eukprot:13883145-Alexandrium_andersonii.AAC.1
MRGASPVPCGSPATQGPTCSSGVAYAGGGAAPVLEWAQSARCGNCAGSGGAEAGNAGARADAC